MSKQQTLAFSVIMVFATLAENKHLPNTLATIHYAQEFLCVRYANSDKTLPTNCFLHSINKRIHNSNNYSTQPATVFQKVTNKTESEGTSL